MRFVCMCLMALSTVALCAQEEEPATAGGSEVSTSEISSEVAVADDSTDEASAN